jgi:hypothetical protein
MQPVEPNVPKEIIEGYTELGNYMAGNARKGFQGITTNSTYDAWTPARAYSHYHGGVRILSETASARLATPITVKFEDLRGSERLRREKRIAEFSPSGKAANGIARHHELYDDLAFQFAQTRRRQPRSVAFAILRDWQRSGQTAKRRRIICLYFALIRNFGTRRC